MCDDAAEQCRRTLRAWHLTLMEQVDQHRAMFFPLEDLREAESRARDIYEQHRASEGPD